MTKKKDILILSAWLQIDGVGTSLISLLHCIDYSRYNVDLMLTTDEGVLLSDVPKEVNYLGVRVGRKGLRFAYRCVVALNYLRARLLGRKSIGWICREQLMHLVRKSLLCIPPKLSNKKYDIALIFGEHAEYAQRVTADVKACWVHEDWGVWSPNIWLMRRWFKSLDYVVNVSLEAKKGFDKLRLIPQWTKSVVIENVISGEWIRKRAKEVAIDKSADDGFRLLSVSRITTSKRIDRALGAARILRQKGIKFKWVFVGAGECLDECKDLVAENHLDNFVSFVGEKENPCPYYLWCDLFVSTSDTETKGVTVCEALMLGKPVVSTNYLSTPVTDMFDGILVDFSEAAVADAIEKLLLNPQLKRQFEKNISSRDYSYSSEVMKIYGMLKEQQL